MVVQIARKALEPPDDPQEASDEVIACLALIKRQIVDDRFSSA